MRGAIVFTCLSVLLSAFSTGAVTITGSVTNASNGRPIVGAIVAFQNLSAANTYSDTTLSGGVFAIAAIPSYLTTGILTVTAQGFATNRQVLSDLSSLDTINVQLAPNGTGAGTKSISGTISSAGSANALSGVQIILLLRAGLSTATPLDTVVSTSDGKYKFDSLSSGLYEITAVRAGYFDNSANTDLSLEQADSLLVNIQMTPVGSRAGSLAGRVTALDTTVALVNAKVLLTRTTAVGGVLTTTPVESVQTAGGGLYSMIGIPATTGYRLMVSDSGYVTVGSPALFALDSAATHAENFLLPSVVIPSCVIRGSVTDSATLAALSATSVVLRQLTPATNQWAVVDSAQTAANGWFVFSGLGVGTYSLTAQRAEYLTYTTPLNRAINLTRNPDTAIVAVALVPVPRGSLYVFVEDNADKPVAGASVSAIMRAGGISPGLVYNGMAGSDGWVALAGVVAGQYDLTVSKSGFNTVTRSGQPVVANASDTTRVTLQAATGATKSVKGSVKTVLGGVAGQALVLLTAKAGGGTTLALVDTCKLDGSYLVSGIPAGYTSVSLAVTKTGFQPQDSNSIPIAGDTTTVNFTLVPNAGVALPAAIPLQPIAIAVLKNGIRVSGIRPGVQLRITLVSTSGRLIARRNLLSDGSQVYIPKSWPGQTVVLRLEQPGSLIIRKILPP